MLRGAFSVLLVLGLAAHAGEPARPFPQHAPYAPGAILPKLDRAHLDAAVASAYDAWKARYFHPGCQPGQAYIAYNLERKADRDAISSSEAQGYGLLLCAFLAGHDPEAQASFDALHAYVRAHPSSGQPGLMAWQQFTGCVSPPGEDDSASDGDLDIAYALLLADHQWGSAGPIHYRDEALHLLRAIQAGEINLRAATVKLGDAQTEGADLNVIRVSDFMPEHFRAFGRATGDPLWARLIDRGYACAASLQANFAPQTGLLPDFAQGAQNGAPTPPRKKLIEGKYDGQYYYNACRVPWRIGLDALLSGEPRAAAVLDPLNAFIGRATGGDPGKIRAGYFLNGRPIDDDDESLAFTGPFGVSAMRGAGHQEWLDRLTARLLEAPGKDDDYYGRTVALLSLVAISGNWWSP